MNLGNLGNIRPVRRQRHPVRPAPSLLLFPTQGAERHFTLSNGQNIWWWGSTSIQSNKEKH